MRSLLPTPESSPIIDQEFTQIEFNRNHNSKIEITQTTDEDFIFQNDSSQNDLRNQTSTLLGLQSSALAFNRNNINGNLQKKSLLKSAASFVLKQPQKLIFDRDVSTLHISKCKSVEELRQNLLIIDNVAQSEKHHATLLMVFYFENSELTEDEVNVMGRAMRGSKERKKHLNEETLNIIYQTIKVRWGNGQDDRAFKKIWQGCVKAMNMKIAALKKK